MGRVLWINGCFSTGKTAVATVLADRLPNAFLLDPEVIGGVLRDRLVPPPVYPGVFQDLSLWRTFTREAVVDAAERFDGIVIVPMTVARLEYFDEVIAGEPSRAPRSLHTYRIARDDSGERIGTRRRHRRLGPEDRRLGAASSR